MDDLSLDTPIVHGNGKPKLLFFFLILGNLVDYIYISYPSDGNKIFLFLFLELGRSQSKYSDCAWKWKAKTSVY